MKQEKNKQIKLTRNTFLPRNINLEGFPMAKTPKVDPNAVQVIDTAKYPSIEFISDTSIKEIHANVVDMDRIEFMQTLNNK